MNFTIRATPDNTAFQVNTLLNVVNSLQPKIEDVLDMDANVRTSIEGTIIRACNRLDILLDDNARWELPDDATRYAHRQVHLANEQAQQNLHITELQLKGILLERQRAEAQAKAQPVDVVVEPPVIKPTRRGRKNQ